MRKLFLIGLIFFISKNIFAAQDSMLNLVCPIQTQFLCSVDGCQNNLPSVTIKIQKGFNETPYYSRCDKNGCDKYEASIKNSGIYFEISPISRSGSVKVNVMDFSFMETLSIGLSSLIGFGICRNS